MTGSGGARASAAPAYSAFAPEAFTARAKSSVSSRNTTAERAGSAATPSYEKVLEPLDNLAPRHDLRERVVQHRDDSCLSRQFLATQRRDV